MRRASLPDGLRRDSWISRAARFPSSVLRATSTDTSYSYLFRRSTASRWPLNSGLYARTRSAKYDCSASGPYVFGSLTTFMSTDGASVPAIFRASANFALRASMSSSSLMRASSLSRFSRSSERFVSCSSESGSASSSREGSTSASYSSKSVSRSSSSCLSVLIVSFRWCGVCLTSGGTFRHAGTVVLGSLTRSCRLP